MVRKWSVPYPAVGGQEERDAYLYLPVGYEEEPGRRYPVLYMFDGQNVFWDEDATYGKSWGMERFLDDNQVPLIVAALECNTGRNNERLDEYSPYRFDDDHWGHFDGHGDDTMEWFIREFKPWVDQNCRTLPDREHTFIAGSSMGGLMSLYALFRYNRIYGRAAALSPSIWVAPEKLKALVARAALQPGTVLYMDYGSREMGLGGAVTCPAFAGMHLRENDILAEILDEEGRPLPPGEWGELVITTLEAEAMPLIRYRTKDLTSIDHSTCECGRTLPRISKFTGRTDDMKVIRGVNVFPTQVETALLSMGGAVAPHYMMIVDREDNLDVLTVMVEVDESMFSDEIRKLDALRNKIAAVLKTALGVSVRVKLVEPKSIQRSEGKAVRVIDNRNL